MCFGVFATTRSIVIEIKLNLDIGLYAFSSFGLSGSFSGTIDRMVLVLWQYSFSQRRVEHLTIHRANCLHNCFTSHVGAGSRPRCLAGEFMMMLEILAIVTGQKDEQKHW